MPDRDWDLRFAAFGRLEELRRERGGVVTSDDLEAGFEFEGERIKFWNRQMGIWRPRQLGLQGAALRPTTLQPVSVGTGIMLDQMKRTDPGGDIKL